MSTTLKKILPSYLLGIIFVFFVTYWSFMKGEKFYFLIPILIISVYQIQCLLILPIIYVVFNQNGYKLKGIDISSFKNTLTIWASLEFSFSVGLIISGFLLINLVALSVFYFIYAIISLPLVLMYLWLKFNWEAKRQNIDLNSVSVSQIYAEIYLLK